MATHMHLQDKKTVVVPGEASARELSVNYLARLLFWS